MKIKRILALAMALVLCFSALTSCSMFDSGDDGKVSFDEPKELYRYGAKYMLEHAYKQTAVVTATVSGESVTTTEVTYYDGDNYYMENNGQVITYYNNVMYVKTANSKKKMNIDVEELVASFEGFENFDFNIIDNVPEDEITLTKNSDGTAAVKFAVNMPYVGVYNYTFIIDSNGRILQFTTENSATVMGITGSTFGVYTNEYGDQYKVTPPADADDYELTDDYMDLMGFGGL